MLDGFSGDVSGKESACQCRSCRRCGFDPWVGNIPWRKPWQPTPVFLLGKFHGQRSLVDYSPWGCKDLDMTEQLNTHTQLLDRIQQWRLQLLDFCSGGGFFKIILLFYFWLCWVFAAAGLFLGLCEDSKGCSLVVVHGLSLQWLLLLGSMGSGVSRHQELWLLGSGVQAQ